MSCRKNTSVNTATIWLRSFRLKSLNVPYRGLFLGDVMTVANTLTSMRIVLVPVFLYFFIVGDRRWAFIVFCVAAGTDLIDGTVARIMKQDSRWGAILDPIADKLMFASVFICMVIAGTLPLWFFLLAFTRDFLISLGAIYIKQNKFPHEQRVILASKFTTLLQMGVGVTALLRYWNPGGFEVYFFGAQLPLIICAAVCIVISGIQYFCWGRGVVRRYHGSAA